MNRLSGRGKSDENKGRERANRRWGGGEGRRGIKIDNHNKTADRFLSISGITWLITIVYDQLISILIEYRKYRLDTPWWKPLWSSAEITLKILQESVRIIGVFSSALHPRCATCDYKWTSNCALLTNSKTFRKKLEENNKIALETTINNCLCLHAKLTVGAWASWKRGQSPYQFPA